MDEDEKTLIDNDVQEEVVDPQNDDDDVTGGVEDEEHSTDEESEESLEDNEGVANPQTSEENHMFAEYRKKRDAEYQELQKQLNERPETDRLMSALYQYGYEGSPEEIADALESQRTGMTIEEVKAEREREKALLDERLNNHPVMQQALTVLEQQNHIQQKMAAERELDKIRKINPEIKSMQDLVDMNDEVFDALVSSGKMTLSKAYAAVHKTKQISKVDTKEHLQTVGGGEAGSGELIEIPKNELEYYKDAFPEDSPKQLKIRYNRIQKRQS